MISVCMATYNGSRYIQKQLDSILAQLEPSDEIILVDDCSSDATIELARDMRDERIKIHRNDTNQGAVSTFELAIRLASGNVIFLSDQDDIWYRHKVKQFLNVFNGHPDVTLVVSDANVINETDDVVATSYFESRGGFSAGLWHNIVKCKYLGCTMAFRHTVAERCLPFPKDIPMHDVWIGCVNSIYGKTYLLDFPLMGYRRHRYNVTPSKRRGLAQISNSRWRLVKNLLFKVFTGNRVAS
ncbi:MAG: glycosyltransferase family 2 protein [Gallionella sp.]